MFMGPIKPSPRRHGYLVVRLLRRWAAGREAGEPQLPSLVGLGGKLGLEPQAVVAIASLFQLTESCLVRPLRSECCCSRKLSSDERAVLLMLDAASARSPLTPASIPHGLPGALLWAVEIVRQLLGINGVVTRTAEARCPFGALAADKLFNQ